MARRLSAVLCLAAVIGGVGVGAGIGVAAADDIGAGTYGCFTRGGREILSRRFTVGEDGGYARGGDSGAVVQTGRSVFFRGGALDGRQALVLPDGGLRLSQTSYCFRLPEVAAPAAAPVAPPPPAVKPASPPAKLIKVQRPGPDPHVIRIGN